MASDGDRPDSIQPLKTANQRPDIGLVPSIDINRVRRVSRTASCGLEAGWFVGGDRFIQEDPMENCFWRVR